MVPPSQGYVSVSRRPPDIEDYIDMIRRYRSWIIGPTFAGLVIAVVVAFLWPDTFVSSAVMRITPQQIPEELVPSVISSQIAQRLAAMQQEILSRTSLSELIQRPSLNLYPSERRSKPMADVLEQMRKDTKIQILDTGTTQHSQQRRKDSDYASAFQISFSYTNKYKAQAVVREFVTKFMEQNAQVQRLQATMTNSFLSDELKAAKVNLDRLDAEITKFRLENQGRLPEQMQSNLQALSSLQMQLGTVNEALNRNNQEKMMLETQLQNLKDQASFIAAGADQGAPQVARNERLAGLNKAILDTETSLAAAKETYKESHPDIRSIEARLRVLKRERDALEKQETENASKAADAPKSIDPKLAKSLEDIKGSIATVQAQIQAKNIDIEQRLKQQDALNKSIQAYQARIEMSPVNEQRYAALLREYDLAKKGYEDMAKKKGISETASNLEERKAGETLEVLDQPSLPDKPTEPNRLFITGIGVAAGLMLGLFLAGVKEVKDTSLKNLKDVRAYTNLPVLTSIPLLENALLIRRRRRLFWLAWSSAIIIGTVAMSSSMYYYYVIRS